MAALDGFVPWTQTVAPTPLPSLTTNAPGASPPVWDEITFPEVIQMEEVHLFCAQDSHAATDRGGRNLWALQKNQRPLHPRADSYDVTGMTTGTDKLTTSWQKWVGYGAHANGSPTSLSTLMNRLPYDRLMHCSAPGAGEQRTDYFGGIAVPDKTIPDEGHQRLFFQKPSSYLDGFYVPAKGFSFFNVRWPDTSHSGEAAPKPFSYLLLAVWEGCVTGVSSTDNLHPEYHFGNLVDGTVAYGAKCSVGFTRFITISGSTDNVWAASFWQALTLGRTSQITGKPDKVPVMVSVAVTYANEQVRQQNNTYEGYDSCRIGGDTTIVVAPAR